MQLLLQSKDSSSLFAALGVVLLLLCLMALGVFSFYFRLWIRAKIADANIGMGDLIRMTFRKVRANLIVKAKITAGQAGLGEETGITCQALEAHYLAGGNVPLVIHAMVAARKAKTISLDWNLATAIDLAGRNILEAVQTSVYPKVIDCPARDSGKTALDAVAKNGIQLKVRTRVTVRANLAQLIGGATEETIIARVGEGIVSAIGSAESHAQVLENPDVISKTVLSKRLDSETAFEIVSIDIADIDVGQNIGARLRADQAEADTRVARAQAEGKRANAVAVEQEKMASIEESRAKVAEAQAEVPKAMAEAFQKGRMGVMEYYRLQNIQADTAMREAISVPEESARSSS
ncbi:MAG: flotillin-like protein FloA [Planctomycetota bacterium]|nr:flotillin-like protein FloA [Planctomycetota bacterium]